MSEVLEKPWWQSRTIIGTFASTAAVVAGMAGLPVDAGTLTEVALGIVAIAGNVFAWYGRVNARKIINKKQILPGITLKGHD